MNDADVMRCIVKNYWLRKDYKILYCEPPKIIDENNECALEIDSKAWKNTFKSLLNSKYFIFAKFFYLENEDSKKHRKIFGKQRFSKNNEIIFAAIGRTSEDSYDLFEMETCYDKITKLMRIISSENIFKMSVILPILSPQLMSIICYLVLLTFYLAIEELRTTVYGKCWINFIINSLINYLATIVILPVTIFKIANDDPDPEIVLPISGQIISITLVFTEFSLYFWLNITFFEAFYIIR
jgi:hypothetical protein